jgi:uncharacterized protein (TIGR02266 family)
MAFPRKSQRGSAAATALDIVAAEAEERALDAKEAQHRERLRALESREEQAIRAIDAARHALATLNATRAGALAVAAAGRLPAPDLQAVQAQLPERVRADEARLLAIQARRTALQAEERSMQERIAALARWEAAVQQAQAEAEQIRSRVAALEAEEYAALAKAEAAAKAAEAARKAAQRPPPHPPGATRRKAERIRFETEVNMESDSNFYVGFSTDLSDGGVFVATTQPAREGMEVDLAFTLPGNRRVEAKGVVRWIREVNDRCPELLPGVGIEFTELSPADKAAVCAFTARREPLFWTA